MSKRANKFFFSLNSLEYEYFMAVPNLKKAIDLCNSRKNSFLDYISQFTPNITGISQNHDINYVEQKELLIKRSEDFTEIVNLMCQQEQIKNADDFAKKREVALIIEGEIETQLAIMLIKNKEMRKAFMKNKLMARNRYEWSHIPSYLGEHSNIELFIDNHRTIFFIAITAFIMIAMAYLFGRLIGDQAISGVFQLGICGFLLYLCMKIDNLSILYDRDKGKSVTNNHLYCNSHKAQNMISTIISTLCEIWSAIKS